MDFQRCSEQPIITTLNQLAPLQTLETASSREGIRTQESDQANIIRNKDEPRKFKDERKWNDWDTGIINYLSTIDVALGVP